MGKIVIYRTDKLDEDGKQIPYEYQVAKVSLSQDGNWFWVHQDAGEAIGPLQAVHPASKVDLIETN